MGHPGTRKNNALTESYLRNSDGVLFVYDLSIKESFEYMKNIKVNIKVKKKL